MAKRIAGITVEIGGDTSALSTALDRVNKTSRNLQTELAEVEKGLKFDPGNSKLIAQRQEILAEAVENTTKKLDILKQAQADVEKKFRNGEISSDQYRAFQRELDKTESQLEAFQKKAQNTDARVDVTADTSALDKAETKLDDVKRAAKDAGREIGQAIGTGAAAAFGAGSAAVIGMTDLNNDLARLRTNAELAGNDLGLVEDAFKDIVAITGETDSAVETLSNLMATGIKDSDLEGVIDGINGAAIKFSDTLKTEGIADGLQETFATGEAIGQFAELLDRSGIDVEDFNKKLALAKETGEETNLILETFASAGLNDVTKAYKESNEELVKNNESSLEMQTALADLAIALTPVVTAITDLITKLTEWAAENPELMTALFVLAGLITAVAGAIVLLTPLFTALSALAVVLGTTIGAIVAPILLVIGAIALLIAAGVAIYKNWDEIKAFFSETWDAIKEKAVEVFESLGEFFSNLWESIKEAASIAWEAIKEFFATAWEGIKEVFSLALQSITDLLAEFWGVIGEGVTTVWEGIKTYFSGVWELIKNIFVGAFLILLQLITGQWQAAWDSTVQIWENIKGALSDMWEGIKLVFSGALEAVKSFVSTAWENMKSITSSAFDTVKSTISNAWDSVKNTFTNTLDTLVRTITNKFVLMRAAVRDKMEEIKTKIKDIWEDVEAFFSGIDLAATGSDIIQGLINGVNNKARDLISSVKGVVNDAIEGAKNLLGIKSPSRVFMEIGKYTGEGMAIGMERSAKLVDDASKVMANASIPDMSRSTNGLSSTDSIQVPVQPIEIPVIVDGREIARATVRDMTELQRQQSNIINKARGAYV